MNNCKINIIGSIVVIIGWIIFGISIMVINSGCQTPPWSDNQIEQLCTYSY